MARSLNMKLRARNMCASLMLLENAVYPEPHYTNMHLTGIQLNPYFLRPKN